MPNLDSPALSVAALSIEKTDDFLRFFDSEAFVDNPDWSGCYCQCFYEDHNELVWRDQSAERNRATARERIRAGTMQGYLAYAGGQPIGWCSAAPRALFRVLDDEPVANAQTIGQIMCYLVAPAYRGQGAAGCRLQWPGSPGTDDRRGQS